MRATKKTKQTIFLVSSLAAAAAACRDDDDCGNDADAEEEEDDEEADGDNNNNNRQKKRKEGGGALLRGPTRREDDDLSMGALASQMQRLCLAVVAAPLSDSRLIKSLLRVPRPARGAAARRGSSTRQKAARARRGKRDETMRFDVRND